MRNIFRRTSTTDKLTGRMEVLETRLIPLIFARMGQEYDTAELQRWIKANDRHGKSILLLFFIFVRIRFWFKGFNASKQ